MNIDEKLLKIVGSKVKGKNLTEESNLTALGLDSIDKADLLIGIEDDFNIQFSDQELATIATIKDLKAAILSKIK